MNFGEFMEPMKRNTRKRWQLVIVGVLAGALVIAAGSLYYWQA